MKDRFSHSGIFLLNTFYRYPLKHRHTLGKRTISSKEYQSSVGDD